MATLTSTWDLDNAVDEQRYYRSTSPIDIDNPPTPVATLLSDDRSYIDTVPAKTAHHIAVSSVKNGVEKFSEIKYIGDLNWNNVVFYSRLNGDGQDLSLINNAPTYGSIVSYSTSVKKFGTASLFCENDINHRISYPAGHFGFAAGEPFTVEGWFNNTYKPTGLWQSPFGTWGASTGWCIFFTPTGLSFNYNAGGLGYNINYLQLTWIHIAVTRDELGMMRMFVNGELKATVFENSATIDKVLYVGGNEVTTDLWRGYIDEVRITKGVCRYKENFTPQQRQFYDF